MRKGFTIYELLIGVCLMLIIGVMMARFGQRVIHTMAATRLRETAAARLDNAMQQLRGDVWHASAMQAVSPHELILTSTDDQQTRWTWSADGHLRRMNSPTDSRDWLAMPEVAMSVDSAKLRVIVSDVTLLQGQTFCAVSPLLLVEEKP